MACHDTDHGLAFIENRMVLRAEIQNLTPEHRSLPALRYFHGHTQQRIGAEAGLSQMHISRLLARLVDKLRDAAAVDP